MHLMTAPTSADPTPSSRAARLAVGDVALPLAPILAFVAGHIVLALVMRWLPMLGKLHAVGALAIGVAIAARGRRHQIAYAVVYIAGCEVMWRMTGASPFWEYGKYAISATLLVALMRFRSRRNVIGAVSYFALLLPSALLTLMSLSPDVARQQLSFNLSGPLALMLGVLFFSSTSMTMDQLHRMFFALIAPALGITALAYQSTISAGAIAFTRQSNSITSGGFGPNQVSSVLGLGLLLSLLMLFERRQAWRIKTLLLAIAVALATQSALTFSRGGLAMAFVSAFVAMFYLVRDARTRVTLALLGGVLYGVASYVVIPRLEVFTEGKISERYASTKTSNRVMLAELDLDLFIEHPALGVGPGVAPSIRANTDGNVAAHTEFTRLLAEHGILGGLSLALLIVIAFRTARSSRTLRARAYVLAMLCWVTLFLVINAMRIAAPAVLFGVACSIAYSSVPRPKRPGGLAPEVATVS